MNPPRVLILRDRKAAGGGIHAYFEAVIPHLGSSIRIRETGRPRGYDGGAMVPGRWSAAWRLVYDWLLLGLEIVRFRPDLVHLNPGLDREARSLKREAVSLCLARCLGCQVLIFWHGWDHPAKGGPTPPGGENGWLWRCYRMAAAHVVLASRFREDLLCWGVVSPIHLATTVVAESLLTESIIPQSKEGRHLLFLSRVERAKGLWELLDAYKILKSTDSAYRLVIAGDGPDLDELKARVELLGLEDVDLVGYVTGDQKLEILRAASIFCFPSYSEGMPLAVLEAMAVGLPLVSSDVGGLRDILRDGENGWLLELRMAAPDGQRFDVSEMVNRISRLANDDVSRTRMGNRNAEMARAQFSPTAVAKKLDAIYQSVLTAASATR